MKLNKRLSTLAERVSLRYFTFIALYFAEGLPMGILFIGIPAWMAMNNKTVTEIGAFDVACAMPWTFKFFIAPMMDRYTFLPMGRKRPWVIICQLGLFISLLVMACIKDPLNNLSLLVAGGFLVSVFGAAQDAATDGLAVDNIPAEEQARANAFMGGARMIGSSCALALSTWLLEKYNFLVSTATIGVMVGLVTLVPLLIREHQEERLLPWSEGQANPSNKEIQINSWVEMYRSLYAAFSLKNAFLLASLLFLSQGSYNYFEKLLPIFAVKVTGWTHVYYSNAFAVADLTGGIAGILLGGWLIERFGIKRMIYIYFFFICAQTLLLSSLSQYWNDSNYLYSYIIVYRWVNAFAKIGVFAIAMQCCSKRVSASQFTFYMTIGAVGSMVGAALISPAKNNFSWEVSFMFFAVMMVLCAINLRALNIKKLEHQIEELEHQRN
ncbi:MFS transporter [uncultured Mucilaginibacter sp.]|uniref:MFS transporter n=1 Tax=uncultured Mucilaginibacter sp. TaxID=797541 RepID=UPI0025CE9EFD|nr:MFS transporter [uncultured Mucilaginibacter sp.]